MRTQSRVMLVAGLAFAFGGAWPATGEEAQPQSDCGKKLVVDGFVRGSTPLAELSAIQNWLEAAAAETPDRAVWHRAQNQSLQCEPVGSQGSVRCTASALPCLMPSEDDKTETTN